MADPRTIPCPACGGQLTEHHPGDGWWWYDCPTCSWEDPGPYDEPQTVRNARWLWWLRLAAADPVEWARLREEVCGG